MSNKKARENATFMHFYHLLHKTSTFQTFPSPTTNWKHL